MFTNETLRFFFVGGLGVSSVYSLYLLVLAVYSICIAMYRKYESEPGLSSDEEDDKNFDE